MGKGVETMTLRKDSTVITASFYRRIGAKYDIIYKEGGY